MISNDPLKANKESTFLSIFENVKYDEVSKLELQNYPNCFRTVVEIPSVPYGIVPSTYDKLKFELPKSGFLKNMYLKTSVVMSTNPRNLLDRAGVRLFDPIILRNGTDTLFCYKPSILMAITKNDTNVDGDYESTTSFYTPLLFEGFPFNESFLLDFHKNFELEISYSGTLGTLTSFVCKLVVELETYEPEVYNSFIFSRYSKPITNILAYKNYCQEVSLLSGSNYCRFLIERGFFLCSQIFLQILTSSWATASIINKIEIESNNKIILSTMDKNRNVAFNYRFDNGKTLSGYSGGINLKTGNYYLNVYYDTLSTAATLYLDLIYHTIFTSDNSTGLIHSRLIA